jgi:hypothetical protein
MATYLRVDYDKREYVTREADRSDEWDRDDTSASWDFKSVGVVSSVSCFDLVVPFDVKKGDDVWVVVAIYSTGDSFGHDDRACAEYIDAFLDKHKARACRDAVEKSRKGWDDYEEKKCEWIREDGSLGKLDYVPWNGYFESLDTVECEYLEVRD